MFWERINSVMPVQSGIHPYPRMIALSLIPAVAGMTERFKIQSTKYRISSAAKPREFFVAGVEFQEKPN
jgi:hypothetical protein